MADDTSQSSLARTPGFPPSKLILTSTDPPTSPAKCTFSLLDRKLENGMSNDVALSLSPSSFSNIFDVMHNFNGSTQLESQPKSIK